MNVPDNQLLTTLQLAKLLGVPIAWLRAEAVAGRIPSLLAGRRRRLFNAHAVEQCLLERAATTNTSAESGGSQ